MKSAAPVAPSRSPGAPLVSLDEAARVLGVELASVRFLVACELLEAVGDEVVAASLERFVAEVRATLAGTEPLAAGVARVVAELRLAWDRALVERGPLPSPETNVQELLPGVVELGRHPDGTLVIAAADKDAPHELPERAEKIARSNVRVLAVEPELLDRWGRTAVAGRVVAAQPYLEPAKRPGKKPLGRRAKPTASGYVDFEEARLLLGAGEDTLKGFIARGDLRGFRAGGSIQLEEDEVRELADRLSRDKSDEGDVREVAGKLSRDEAEEASDELLLEDSTAGTTVLLDEELASGVRGAPRAGELDRLAAADPFAAPGALHAPSEVLSRLDALAPADPFGAPVPERAPEPGSGEHELGLAAAESVEAFGAASDARANEKVADLTLAGFALPPAPAPEPGKPATGAFRRELASPPLARRGPLAPPPPSAPPPFAPAPIAASIAFAAPPPPPPVLTGAGHGAGGMAAPAGRAEGASMARGSLPVAAQALARGAAAFNAPTMLATKKKSALMEMRPGAPATTPPAAKAEATVEDEPETFERKATVRYYSQMYARRNYPLLVVVSKRSIQKIVQQHVAQVEGKKSFKIRRGNPFVTVRPIIPGCLCVPAELTMNVKPKVAEAKFWVTPQAEGELAEARVEVLYEGKVVSTIETPTRVTTQALAKASGALAFFSTSAAPMFDAFGVSVKKVGASFLADLLARVAEGGFLAHGVTAAFAFLALMLYLKKRPKAGPETEGFFDWGVEDEVEGDPLVRALKAKLAIVGPEGREVVDLVHASTLVGSGGTAHVRIRGTRTLPDVACELRHDDAQGFVLRAKAGGIAVSGEDVALEGERRIGRDGTIELEGGKVSLWLLDVRQDAALDGRRDEVLAALVASRPTFENELRALFRRTAEAPVRAALLEAMQAGWVDPQVWLRVRRNLKLA